MTTSFLLSSIQLFRYYKGLADKSMVNLNTAQLYATPGPDDNNIAIIIQHMAGNMLSTKAVAPFVTLWPGIPYPVRRYRGNTALPALPCTARD